MESTRVHAITSGPRTAARAAKKTKTCDRAIVNANNELDTRADTIVAGANYRLVEDTGTTCSVSGFYGASQTIKGIRVGTVATAWTDAHSLVHVLIIHEALYFGERLDHSLINPNQIRMNGIPVCDDPCDPYRELGIEYKDDEREVLIPFTCEGATVLFRSRVPTDEEMRDCPKIVLTSEATWEPSSVNMHGKKMLADVSSVSTNKGPPAYESGDVTMQMNGIYSQRDVYERMIEMAEVNSCNDAPRRAKGVYSDTRHSIAGPQRIMEVFGVSAPKAKDIEQASTCAGLRTATHPITRRYRAMHGLGLDDNRIQGRYHIDWMTSKTKGVGQETGAQVMTSERGLVRVYPGISNTTEHASHALDAFCQDAGVPERLHSDRAKEYCANGCAFLQNVKKKQIDTTYTEPGRHEMHNIDVLIRELKKRYQDKMRNKNVPSRLWPYVLEHQAKIMSLIPRGREGRSGYEIVTGKTPDISEYIDFDIWDPVWYHREDSPDKRDIGRWIGISHRIGSDMCYWIVTKSGTVIAETTVQHFTRDDSLNDEHSKQLDVVNESIRAATNDKNFQLQDSERHVCIDTDPWDSAYGDSNERTPSDEDYGDSLQRRKDEDDIPAEVYDKLIGAEVHLTHAANDGLTQELATAPIKAKVRSRVRDDAGNPVGVRNNNPLLDTSKYEVETADGVALEMFANDIAECMYSQIDFEGNEMLVFCDIVDHRKDGNAIPISEGMINDGGRNKKPKRTTAGWHLKVEFANGDTEWVALKDVKGSNPIELADYAQNHGLLEEPAFAWWAPYTLKKRTAIISKTVPKYWRTTHKFGIEVPKTVERAYEIDKENKNDLWHKAICKEMDKVCIAYKSHDKHTPQEVRDNKAPELAKYQEIGMHIIFDIKMDFTRKARFVAGGHTTDTPSSLTYSSVVSRDSVRIAFMYAGLNDLEVSSCDIGNAYLNAPCRELIWFEAGKECGEDAGKVMICTRAIYGLKSSGAAWRSMFSQFIEKELKFTSTRVDADVYRRKARKPDGGYYYELLLVYVDDCLLVSHDPNSVMKKIQERFDLKDGFGEPKVYLGAETVKHQTANGTMAWGLKSTQYVKNIVATISADLEREGRRLKGGRNRKNRGPLPTNYKPELDVSPEVGPHLIQRYQAMMGMLRWAIELGRIDIEIETSLLSQYQSSPREGHLEAAYSIVHYLQENPSKVAVMDPADKRCDSTRFNSNANWEEIYGDITEDIPPDAPEPLGAPITITVFVDSDHASNAVTRRSHTGVLVFVQNALILSYCKRQNTVESATFGSELVAMRLARDLIVGLRVKLRMFGIPILGPANFFCDNEGVVKNTSIPESTLNKKHNSINYHVIRESVAQGIMQVAKEPTETNMADALTKIVPYERKKTLLGPLLVDVPDDDHTGTP